MNVPVGTIFSVVRKITRGRHGEMEDMLQPGRRQVAAGYVIYGSSTMLVYTTGQGAHGFTLDPSIGEFLLSHPNIRIPDDGRYLSVNDSYESQWDDRVRTVMRHYRGLEAITAALSTRYVGSLVADFHRNLLGGGIFAYPANTQDAARQAPPAVRGQSARVHRRAGWRRGGVRTGSVRPAVPVRARRLAPHARGVAWHLTPPADGPDLQRVASGRAIIGDPRNDKNLVVSQLQVVVLQFHNMSSTASAPSNPRSTNDDVFKLAQQTVRWHYQWIVVHDFLRRLVGPAVIDDILKSETYATPSGRAHTLVPRLRFYHWRETPFMPVEFSVAAYRFGHSMARPSYVINDVIPLPVVSGAAASRCSPRRADRLQNLNGFRPLPNQWGFQWKYFLPHIHDVAGPNDAHLPQPAYKLDAELSMPLGALPASVAAPETLVTRRPPALAQNLAARNLLRGLRLGVPAGEDVARAMGITPLTDTQLYGGLSLSEGAHADLAGRTPLWYYVLKEAEVLAGSAHLGPVGGRIVAEVLIGLLGRRSALVPERGAGVEADAAIPQAPRRSHSAIWSTWPSAEPPVAGRETSSPEVSGFRKRLLRARAGHELRSAAASNTDTTPRAESASCSSSNRLEVRLVQAMGADSEGRQLVCVETLLGNHVGPHRERHVGLLSF